MTNSVWLAFDGEKLKTASPKNPGSVEYIPAKDYNELIDWLHGQGIESMKEALQNLAKAADLYAADQSLAEDPRVGLTQPVSVEDAEELNNALRDAWAIMDGLPEPLKEE